MSNHLAAMISQSVEKFGTRPALSFREASAADNGTTWKSISYEDFGQRIRSVATALVDVGVAPGDRVGIFSANKPEWSIADFAILTAAAVSVPLYATSTAAQAEYVINDAGLNVIFVGGQEQYDKVQQSRGAADQLNRIVVFDEGVTLADDRSTHFSTFLRAGSESDGVDALPARLAAAGPQDVATLIYTSGTTGEPKGVELTHANFFHQLRALDVRFDVGPDDTSLCFLPLTHAYERGWSMYVFYRGAQNYYLDDPKNVVSAMAEVRPTLMVSVPRLFEKIHATVLDQVDRGSAPKKSMFQWALGVGGKYQHRKADKVRIGPLLAAEHAVADRLVLAKIRDVVGGPKNVFSAGGAPLSKEIEEFFFAVGVLICQGYGLTETTAMLTCNSSGGFRFGTVGLPVLGSEVRIAEHGEIQVRGENVMKGYFGRPQDTAAAFQDGWLRTGDVGSVDADGYLTVTDRIKDLIITSQGKNVAPQHVEGELGADLYIDQVVVIGDRRSYLTALITPDFEVLERYAHEHDISVGSREELVADSRIHDLYDQRIAEASCELAGYEQVKRYTLLAHPFSQEGGELTPTLKIRRRVVTNQYADVINAMYAATRSSD
jgi:long-chain acyl-CoA synthetase